MVDHSMREINYQITIDVSLVAVGLYLEEKDYTQSCQRLVQSTIFKTTILDRNYTLTLGA